MNFVIYADVKLDIEFVSQFLSKNELSEVYA